MGTYLIRRLLSSVFTVWAALTFMFLLMIAMPGDAVEAKSGEKFTSEQTMANVREKYGLDKPLIVQYGRFFVNLAQGDLGYSIKNDRSVNTELKETMKTSLRLLFWGGAFQVLGSLALGFLSAVKRGSFVDKFSTIVSIAAQAIPVFITGLLAQVFFGVIPGPNGRNWSWMNFNREGWPGEDGWTFGVIPTGGWKGIVMPAIVVGIVQMAFLARLLRSSMLEVLRADYLRTAVAKGLSKRRVMVRHALRNALIPWTTATALALLTIFGIAVQTETVFGLFGMGSRIGDAAQIQDAPVVLGLSAVVILFAALLSLAVDIFYSVLDPRIRLGSKGEAF
jgi:oligopeptide transport system permease protein